MKWRERLKEAEKSGVFTSSINTPGGDDLISDIRAASRWPTCYVGEHYDLPAGYFGDMRVQEEYGLAVLTLGVAFDRAVSLNDITAAQEIADALDAYWFLEGTVDKSAAEEAALGWLDEHYPELRR